MGKSGGAVGEAEGSSSDEVGVETRKRIRNALSPNNQQDELYTELWHACAGPLVYVPRAGDSVFYFPQGHIEQVEAYMDQDANMDMPVYNLPSKILCTVVNVQLKAEAGTDEVFAHITLLPGEEQYEPSSQEDGNSQSPPRKTYARSFVKKLTPSDTSTHGGFSVPKRHADDECLPPLDMSQQPPVQDLLAKDLHGFEWNFRHIYRGQPKRHLFTSGWSTFVTSKKLIAGDSFVFLRGENGELRVGVRRAMKPQNIASTTVISAHSIQHGILASALHAISTGTIFTVYYRPWTSLAEFIVPFDKYMKSAEIDYSVGTRFRMLFEGDEGAEQRVEGTVVDIEDVDCIQWSNSEWRSFKVKWDPTSDASVLPKRVSPWNIEAIEPVKKKHTSLLHQSKRARPVAKDGVFVHRNHSEVLQGQENRDMGDNELCELKLHLMPHVVSPPISDWNRTPFAIGTDNQPYFPMYGPLYPCPSNAVSFPGGNIVSLGLHNSWYPTVSSYGVHDNAVQSRNLSAPNSCNSHYSRSQNLRDFKLKDANEVLPASPNGDSRFMLFGVNLVKNPPELPSPQVATSSEHESHYSVPPTSQSTVSEPSKSTCGTISENQCKNCCSSSSQNCIKVLKYGSMLGRSVDLTRFGRYDELICELDQMFDFEGSLIDGSSGWHVVYRDNEGDLMLLGDYPWQVFQFMVQRMIICPKEDIDRLNPSSPN